MKLAGSRQTAVGRIQKQQMTNVGAGPCARPNDGGQPRGVAPTILCLLFSLLCLLTQPAYAAPSKYLNYQGKLSDSAGKALTGTHTMVFRIYDASTVGTKVWEESNTVTLSNGIFTVLLGKTTAIDLTFNKDYWMSLDVDSDGEMSPRQQIVATAYSINSSYLNGISSDSFLRSDEADTMAGTLTFSGVTTDVTTGANEDFTVNPNGTGNVVVNIDAASTGFKVTDGTTDWLVIDDAGNATFTSDTATDLFNVKVGNLKVGDGTPTNTLSGESAYVEGSLEVDGILYADGGISGTVSGTGGVHVPDDKDFGFGNTAASPDAALQWDTAQTQDALLLGLSGSNSLLLLEYADMGGDYAHSTQTNPTLFVHSATAASSATNQWVSLAHDATNAVIQTGTGDLVLKPAGNDILPSAASTDNLGSSTLRWNSLYVATLDATTITSSSSITGTSGETMSGGIVNLNVSSNYATNINTGTSSGAVSVGGGSGTVAIDSSDWDISATGAMTGIGAITADGLVTGSAGATISGATTSINKDSNFATNINTGTSSGAVSLGGGSGTVAVDSSDWDISTAGAMTRIDSIANTSADLALSTTTSGNITATPAAATGLFNVVTGNLRVGTGGTPGSTLDGEDAYIEGNMEVDGTLYAATLDSGTTITHSLDAAFDDGKIIDGATSSANAMQVGDGSSDLLFYTASSVPTIATEGTTDLTIVPGGTDTNITGDVTINANAYSTTPTGGLFVAVDPTAANSDGYVFLGRRSVETGGWMALRGNSSNGKLIWNGSEIEAEGDSPASFTFGNSTAKVSLTYDPATDSIWFSRGVFTQQFRNMVKNGSFEAFSAIENFRDYDPTMVASGTSTIGGTYNTATGGGYQGGWKNFAPDEWTWKGGKIYHRAPLIYTSATTTTATFLQQDYYHGKGSLALEDTNTASNDLVTSYPRESWTTAADGSYADAHVEQRVTGLRPNAIYSIGVYMMRTDDAVAVVDVTGEETTPSGTLNAALGTEDNKLTLTAASFSSFPNNGIVKIGSERISYTGKDTATNQLTSLIRAYDGTTVGSYAIGASVTFAPFKYLTTSDSTTDIAGKFTLYKGQFASSSTAGDITIHLACYDATGAATGQCRFDAVQVVEGRSVPEFQPSPVVDTGDQTVYGSLRLGRTSNEKGGILSVDRFVRTRGLELFTDDPGLTGKVGGGATTLGGGGIFPPGSGWNSVNSQKATVNMFVEGTYSSTAPANRSYKVKITTDGTPDQFSWWYMDDTTTWIETAPAGSTNINVTTSAAAAVTLNDGVKVWFDNSATGVVGDTWWFSASNQQHFAAGAMGTATGGYDSYGKAATYTSGETRIYKDPDPFSTTYNKLVFQDGMTKVTLQDLAGTVTKSSYISPPTPGATGYGLGMSAWGNYDGSNNRTYRVEIATAGTANSSSDTFKWKKSTDNGVTWSAFSSPNTTITGTEQTLENGIRISFYENTYTNDSTITGGMATNYWTFSVSSASTSASNAVASLKTLVGSTEGTALTGAVRLKQGSNILLTTSGNDIEIASSATITATSQTLGKDETAPTSNIAGQLKFISGGNNAWSSTFNAGTQSGDITYTLPISIPVSGSTGVLKSTDAGLLTWSSVGTGEITDGTIASADIGTDVIAASNIAAGAVGTSEIADGTVGTADIALDTIAAVDIATDAVTTTEILDGTVASADIALDTIAAVDIAADAVTTTEILDGTVASTDIALDTIVAVDIATGAVDTAEILDGAVVNADVGASAAIAGTKISPDFGTQDISTTGNLEMPFGGVGRYQNLLLRSEEFDNASWTKTGGVTVAANDTTVTAPDGASNADKLTDDATAGGTLTQAAAVTLSADTSYIFSVWLRSGTGTSATIKLQGDAAGDTATETASLTLTTTWTRHTVTDTITNNAGGGENITATINHTGGANNTIFAWGAQLEAGTVPNVYARTTSEGRALAYGLQVNQDMHVTGNMEVEGIFTQHVSTNDQTMSGNLVVNGNTTLGDANTDTVTIKAGPISLQNATAAADGLEFGSGANLANLYRSANDTLKTDDIFVANAGLTVTTGTVSLPSGQIESAEIADGTITTDDIALDTIAAVDIATDAVTTTEILDSTVASADIALDTIAAVDIAADAVGTSEIADGTVASADIALDTIAAVDIAADAVTTTEILDGTVASADIALDTIAAVDIATDAVTTTEILDGTVASADIALDTIAAVDIATDAVTTTEILDSTVASADIALDTIAAVDIAVDAVTTTEILDSTVASADIALDTIAAVDIATDAVTTTEILDGTIATADLANDAVSDAKVANDITASNYLPLAGGTITGTLSVAVDPAAANSDGLIRIGRKSDETSGWSELKYDSTTKELEWNGATFKLKGDSPVYMRYGSSTMPTTEYAWKFNPDVTPKTLSMMEINTTPNPDAETELFRFGADGSFGVQDPSGAIQNIIATGGKFKQQFQNLVRGGSFEGYRPTGWDVYEAVYGTDVYMNTVSSNAKFGTKSLEIKDDNTLNSRAAFLRVPDYDRLKGKTVTVSLWARTNSGQGRTAIGISTDGGTNFTVKNIPPTAASQTYLTTTYQQFSHTFSVPSNATSLNLYAFGSIHTEPSTLVDSNQTDNDGAGTDYTAVSIYFDGITLVEGSLALDYGPSPVFDMGDQVMFGNLAIGAGSDASTSGAGSPTLIFGEPDSTFGTGYGAFGMGAGTIQFQQWGGSGGRFKFNRGIWFDDSMGGGGGFGATITLGSDSGGSYANEKGDIFARGRLELRGYRFDGTAYVNPQTTLVVGDNGTGGAVSSANINNATARGDAYIKGNLEVDGTIYGTVSGSTASTGTTESLFKIDSDADAAATDITLQFGNTNPETIKFSGASNDRFDFTDSINIPTGKTYMINGSAISTSNVGEGTNLYYTDGRARASLSNSAPITYNSSTGAIGISDATTAAKGAASFNSANFAVASGDVTIKSGGVTTAEIAADTITAGDIATGAVDSTEIFDGAVVNTDVGTAAAIAGTKISPDFGTQNISTTGYLLTPFGGVGRYENLILRSEELDNASWTKSANTTISATNASAPDGTTNADTISFAAAAGTDTIKQASSTAAASTQFTGSAWLKAGSAVTVRLGVIDQAGSPAGTYTNCSVTTSWQRFTVTHTFASGATGNAVLILDDNATGSTVAVDTWGAQLEKSSAANVYTRTTSETRALAYGMAVDQDLHVAGNLEVEGIFTQHISTSDQTLSGNLVVNGNATLGDSNADTVTVNAGPVKLVNATAAADAMEFGSGANLANLYKSANDTLKTDDTFVANAGLTVTGGTVSLPSGQIESAEIADGTVGTDDIALDTIAAVDIATDAVTTTEILDSTVASADIAVDTIAAVDIATDAVTTTEILDSTVASADIAVDTIAAVDIAADAVGTSEIADGTVASADIAVDTIAAVDIAAGAVGTSEIADDTVASADIAADTIAAVDIATDAVTTTEILDSTVASADIAADTIAAVDIATDAVTTTEILDSTVASADIAVDTIAAVDIAAGAVGTSEILDATIAAADLAAGSVTVAKLNQLRPHEQVSPDATVKVEAGVVTIGGAKVNFAAGNSPAFGVVTANSRIDLLTIDSAGALAVVAGTQAASPTAPTYPVDKIVIAEVTVNETVTVVVNDADINDVRPVFSHSNPTGTTYTAGSGLGLTGTEFSVASAGVTSAMIAVDTIAAVDIATDAVTTTEILDSTVASADIAADTIAAVDIATDAVTTTEILDSTVASADIAADTIAAVDIATDAVTTTEILDSTVASADIAADTIAAVDIATDAVTTTEILDSTVASADIAADTIAAVDIATDAVTTTEILDSTVASADIALDTIAAVDIAADAVGTSEIADGTVASADIAVDTIAAVDIAAGAVGTSEILDATIAAADLAAGSVTVAKLNQLRPHEQASPDNTVRVEAGVVTIGGAKVNFAAGNSPAFGVVTANSRIDLLTIDSAGALAVVAGTQAASPTAPTYPVDKIVIAEVTVNETVTVVVNDADINDVRPVFSHSNPTGTTYTAGSGLGLTGTEFSIASAGVTSAMIAVDTIAAVDIATDAVTTAEILDSTVASADIALDTIAAVDIATDAVTTTEILDSTVASADIALDTIAAVDIAAGGVGTSEILDATIAAADLAAGSVTVAKLNQLRPHEQATPDATVRVEAGVVTIGGAKVNFAAGNSPAFGVVTANSRIDLLVINSSGTLSVVAGTQAPSPTAPAYPVDKIVIAEVTVNETVTVVVNDADINDVRPVFSHSNPTGTTYTAGSGLGLTGTEFSIASAGVTSAMIAVDTIAAVDIATDAVTTAEILDSTVASADIALDTIAAVDIATDAVTTTEILDSTVASADIAADTILAGNIAAGAVATSEILDDTIANADVNASAAIAGTKISPNFGTQNIVTNGNISIRRADKLILDSDDTSDTYIIRNSGAATISWFIDNTEIAIFKKQTEVR